jgi:hypothetical protein
MITKEYFIELLQHAIDQMTHMEFMAQNVTVESLPTTAMLVKELECAIEQLKHLNINIEEIVDKPQ